MTTTEFLSKANLQRFCQRRNLAAGMEFKRVPGFGWFSWNRTDQKAQTLFDFFPAKIAVEGAYDLVTKGEPDLKDTNITFSETSKTKLINHYERWRSVERFYQLAVEEVQTNAVFCPPGQTDRVRFSKWIESNGLREFVERAGIGLVTERVLEAESRFQYPIGYEKIGKLRHCLVVPSFVAPGRLCTLSRLDPFSFHMTELYRLVEPGWFGQLNVRIHERLDDLLGSPGCTWDHKVPLWTNEAVELSEKLSASTCLSIWDSPFPILCDPSPLVILKGTNPNDRLDNLTNRLTLAKVEELERVTGNKDLVRLWRSNRTTIALVGGHEFSRSDNRYYVTRNGQSIPFTNFTLTLTRIVRVGGRYMQHGLLYFKDEEVPFVLPRNQFKRPRMLAEALERFMLDSGLGVPTVCCTYLQFLPDVIAEFNQDNEVVLSTDTELPTDTKLVQNTAETETAQRAVVTVDKRFESC